MDDDVDDLVDDVDPLEPRTCRNAGCGARYTEAENADDACLHHPGPPVFHERKKGWACCDVHVYDFDEFMRVPPCAGEGHRAPARGTRRFERVIEKKFLETLS